jgi:hypothetical protein
MAGSAFGVLDRLLAQQKMALMDVLRGVKAGLSDDELTLRHRLTPSELRYALNQLLVEGLIDQEDIEGRRVAPLKVYRPAHPRAEDRRFPTFDVKVRFGDDPVQEGFLLDVSERGLSTQGLRAIPGEEYALTLVGDDIFGVDLFTFRVRCRWARENGCDGGRSCGFEIIDMAEESIDDFRQWLVDWTEVEEWGDLGYEHGQGFESDGAQPGSLS